MKKGFYLLFFVFQCFFIYYVIIMSAFFGPNRFSLPEHFFKKEIVIVRDDCDGMLFDEKIRNACRSFNKAKKDVYRIERYSIQPGTKSEDARKYFKKYLWFQMKQEGRKYYTEYIYMPSMLSFKKQNVYLKLPGSVVHIEFAGNPDGIFSWGHILLILLNVFISWKLLVGIFGISHIYE